MPLEIACFTPTSAIIAATSTPPASRIELCTNASVGGLTPSLSDFRSLKARLTALNVSVPIYVMIRPHARDFVYTPPELSEMLADIQQFKNAGADGFVFGCLRHESDAGERFTIDEEQCRLLVSAAGGFNCTFHRAFDLIETAEMASQLDILVHRGFTGVLASGGARTAVEGKKTLKELVKNARGRIDIIVGGGVRSGNLEGLKDETSAKWFHSSAVVEENGELASKEEVERLGTLVS